MERQVSDVIGDYRGFMASINDSIAERGIGLDELVMCDHICYRVEAPEDYARICGELIDFADLIGEVEVAGRPISTLEFKEPLIVGGWTIPCIEVPFPKDGSPYSEGLEHAEFVTLGSLADFMAKHADLPFQTGALGKTINPEIGLPGRKPGEPNIKLHELPLGAVVRLEERLANTE